MIDRRPVAYVALDAPVYDPDPDTLGAELAKLFPGKPVRLNRLPDSRDEAGRLLLELNGVKLTIVSVAAPIPRETWAEATAGVTLWPEAARAFELHRSHLIVAGVAIGDTHRDALGAAVATTLLTAALCDDHRAIAIYWGSSSVACRPQMLIELAEAMLSAPDFSRVPIDLWVRLFLTRDDGGRHGAFTAGLLPFVEREIEFKPAAMPLPEVAARVLDLATYLIRSGPVIADGDTIGQSATEKLSARFGGPGGPGRTPLLQVTSG